MINGPIPISPDGEPIMGLAPERDNFYVACGFTSGIAASGGAGKAMAEWIVEGEPGLDLWAFDVRRFGSHHMSAQLSRRAQRRQLLALLPDPLSDRGAASAARRPALAALSAAGGQERRVRLALRLGAAQLVRAGRQPSRSTSPPSRARPNWFGPVGSRMPRRARARRADRPELLLQVRDRRARAPSPHLQRLAANDLDRPPGALVYTQLCNERGGIEADLTFARLDENRFYMVTGSAFGVRDMGWIRKHLPTDGSVTRAGARPRPAPRSTSPGRCRAQILQQVADGDVGNAAFPYMTARELRIGFAPVLALRVTYLGELG